MWCDNLSTVIIYANLVLHARTKHVEMNLYVVRDKVLHSQIQVKHVSVCDQLADVLIKPISGLSSLLCVPNSK